jgi:ribosomal protein S18 acetylase RimI-like enzyme
MRLDTYINNPKAIAFYKRIGYNQLGDIKLKLEKDIYYCFEKILT